MSSPTIPRPSDGPVRDVSKFATDPPGEAAAGDKKNKKAKKAAKNSDPKAKKKKIVIAVVLLAALAAAYLFVLKPEPPGGAPQPGIVLKLDPLTLNLEGGHYLKLSMALQFTTAAAAGGGGHGGGEGPDGSQALDIAISQLSNRRIAELNSAAARKKAKATLLEAVAEAYHHEVMDIYFTEFVMQ